jgi:hypothetical protein
MAGNVLLAFGLDQDNKPARTAPNRKPILTAQTRLSH